MHQRSLACSGGTGNERDFSSARFEINAHQNGGGSITRVNIREPDQDSALEKVEVTVVWSGHDWTS